ncbi:4'-phosphopantetheinyl transferase family protein [Caldalkalibacillus mannanilyticus]|uniref:4'-phosphopantetheinyl transferase family protein n=1 Tax=Caldalkalibacillus mannanilyticus TaxID=1418 RepID=UPI000469DE17|nr:4'-phosphopantetheinyl transferase superfamily protein [Caldalkalibacillus mannanilyticus]
MKEYHYLLKPIILHRADRLRKAILCFIHCPNHSGALLPELFLHPTELEYFQTLKHERRKKSYLLGRLAAKKAIGELAERKDLSSIHIQSGIFTQPIITSPVLQNVQVSIAHSEDYGVAIAFPEEHPMGIDIEEVDEEKKDVLAEQLTESEKQMIKVTDGTDIEKMTVLWTVKEAISKILKTGLMTPLAVYELSKIEKEGAHTYKSFYTNFGQYKAVSYVLHGFAYTLAYPKNTEIDFTATQIDDWLERGTKSII